MESVNQSTLWIISVILRYWNHFLPHLSVTLKQMISLRYVIPKYFQNFTKCEFETLHDIDI